MFGVLDSRRVRDRVRRQLKKPINRELGRWLDSLDKLETKKAVEHYLSDEDSDFPFAAQLERNYW